MGNQQTNWTVYTDGAIKRIDVKPEDRIKGTKPDESYNKHDLLKGKKELENLYDVSGTNGG